ncbi:uncharacterized protein LOC130709872 [Lotus japonicus]|uniref:uncharacterized protein LOC130709872 n=1 Tax=Lotus japonicus TaxID=34305 RepID=UPI00258B3C5D|nr:uncharacterized protein LOC130709872 [Lotus japonicus]
MSRFTALKSHYKVWQKKYFKVMESPEIKNLFRDSDNNPLFPFYWTKNPRRKISVSYDALDESEQGIADYLRTLPVISGHDLIEASKSGTLNQFFTTMGKGKVDTNPLKLKDYLAQSAAAAKKRAADNEQKKKNEDASGSDTVRDPKRQRTSGAAGGKPSHQSTGEASKRQPAEKKKGHDAVPPPHQDSSLLINRPPTPFSQAGTSSAIGGEAPPPLLSLNDPHFNGTVAGMAQCVKEVISAKNRLEKKAADYKTAYERAKADAETANKKLTSAEEKCTKLTVDLAASDLLLQKTKSLKEAINDKHTAVQAKCQKLEKNHDNLHVATITVE